MGSEPSPIRSFRIRPRKAFPMESSVASDQVRSRMRRVGGSYFGTESCLGAGSAGGVGVLTSVDGAGAGGVVASGIAVGPGSGILGTGDGTISGSGIALVAGAEA